MEDADATESKAPCEEVATIATLALDTKVLVPMTRLVVEVAKGEEIVEELVMSVKVVL